MERRELLMGMGLAAMATIGQGMNARASETAPQDADERRKVAIICGISSGIGQATALALAERGVDTIGTYRNNQPGALKTVEHARERSTKVVLYHLDLNHIENQQVSAERCRHISKRVEH